MEPSIEQVLLACRSTFESNGLPHDLRVRLGLTTDVLDKLITRAMLYEKVVEAARPLLAFEGTDYLLSQMAREGKTQRLANALKALDKVV